MGATVSRLLALGVVAALLTGCGPDQAEEARDVCADLGNLGPTVGLLLVPPPGTSVGALRDAFEKTQPTVDRARRLSAVSPSHATGLRLAIEDLRAGLDGVSDDEPASTVEERLDPARRTLATSLAGVEVDLGCAGAATA